MLKAAILWVGAVALLLVAACGDSSSTDDSKVAPTTPAATKPAPTSTPTPPPPTSTPAPSQPSPTATSAPEPDEAAVAAPEVGDPAPDFELAARLHARRRHGLRPVAGVLPGRQERGGGLLQGLLVTGLSGAARRADKGVRGDTGPGCGGPGDQRRRPERSDEGRTGPEHTVPNPV